MNFNFKSLFTKHDHQTTPDVVQTNVNTIHNYRIAEPKDYQIADQFFQSTQHFLDLQTYHRPNGTSMSFAQSDVATIYDNLDQFLTLNGVNNELLHQTLHHYQTWLPQQALQLELQWIVRTDDADNPFATTHLYETYQMLNTKFKTLDDRLNWLKTTWVPAAEQFILEHVTDQTLATPLKQQLQHNRAKIVEHFSNNEFKNQYLQFKLLSFLTDNLIQVDGIREFKQAILKMAQQQTSLTTLICYVHFNYRLLEAPLLWHQQSRYYYKTEPTVIEQLMAQLLEPISQTFMTKCGLKLSFNSEQYQGHDLIFQYRVFFNTLKLNETGQLIK